MTEDLSWEKALLNSRASIQDAIVLLNTSSLRIALIVDEKRRLIGTVTDGDIRRAILKGFSLATPVKQILNSQPIVVSKFDKRQKIKDLMFGQKLLQIPVVDELGQVIGMHIWDEIQTPLVKENLLVIMAGGKGTRLLPRTLHLPKPMLQIAGKPILEHIITGARNQGFRNIALAVHHLAEVIENYFGDGSSSGVEIQYLREEFPLGTAGALSLINPPPKEDILVINGDVITDLRFERILDFHEQFQAMGTMAVQMHELQNPFGVVNTSGVEIVSYEEKPSTHSMINAGIYVLDPSAVSLLEPKTYFSMPALFERLRENGYKTIAYPIHEKWTDIGRHDDFAKAEMDM